MKKDKKSMRLQGVDIIKFNDIQQVTESSEAEPPREFDGTIKMGKRIIQLNTTDKEK